MKDNHELQALRRKIKAAQQAYLKANPAELGLEALFEELLLFQAELEAQQVALELRPEQQHVNELSTLNRIAQILAVTLDLPLVLETVAWEMVQIFEGLGFTISLCAVRCVWSTPVMNRELDSRRMPMPACADSVRCASLIAWAD